MFVNLYQTTRHHIPEHSKSHSRHCEKLEHKTKGNINFLRS